MKPSQPSWNTGTEPTELQLPIQGREPIVDRLEQQFDGLLDLLAADQLLEAAGRNIADSLPTASAPQELLPTGRNPATDAELEEIELSVVMPCLDEAETIGNCVLKAQYALEKMGIMGEVIVADNGSRDDSTEIAEFYRKLVDGADLVQGCRLPSGGGKVMAGAMPPLHRWLGNPALSFLVRTMFQTPIHDVYCGMRGFRKKWQQSLDQRCTGMEFATEMIIKTTLFRGVIREVPITLHPDGRVHSRSHLRTFRDGWRTLRFFMLLSPRWTFLIPGAFLALIGLVLCAMAIPQWNVGAAALDVHTLLVGTLSILVASQMGWCAVLAKTFAITEGILPHDRLFDRFGRIMNLERLLALSLTMVGIGVALIGAVAMGWAAGGFGALEYARTMRWVIPGAGLIALGTQFAASSFLMSVLRMARL